MAEVGFMPKVRGISKATPVMGPIPGKTPMTVPRKTPINAKSRLNGVPATLNPKVTLCQKFMVGLLSHVIGQEI
jgi:hypothetical protein